MTANPVRRSMAKVEFLANREMIDDMLSQGFSKKLIHERLIAEGRSSMHYITFCEFIRKANKLPPIHPPKQRDEPTPSVRPGRQPGIIKADPKPFPDPRTIDPKTLI